MDSESASSVSANVLVAVRIRPLTSSELANNIQSCCQVIGNEVVAIKKNGDAMQYLKSQQLSITEYGFDAVFDEKASQRDVYEKTAKRFINPLLDGENVTVFAYGATGAGKTHTMLGNTRADEAASRADAGLIPNAVYDLFQSIHNRMHKHSSAAARVGESYEVSLSFLEVYNEQVYDLLEDSGKVLSVREDQEKGIVVVAGITEQPVRSYEQVLELISQGNRRRKTEATMANAVSSRSHAVLQLLVRHNSRQPDTGREIQVDSKLSLIDLAGSERASATNNRGLRLHEGANINKSLLALANCINALAENAQSTNGKRNTNVKYRDSKLTHLLKSSLEGNCNLVMIANVNPSDVTYEDSHNTLKYANRAKNIKVNPAVREIARDKENSSWLQRETQLRSENNALRQIVERLEGQVHELQRFRNAVLQNNGILPSTFVDHVSSHHDHSCHDDMDVDEYAHMDSSLSSNEELFKEGSRPVTAPAEALFRPRQQLQYEPVLPTASSTSARTNHSSLSTRPSTATTSTVGKKRLSSKPSVSTPSASLPTQHTNTKSVDRSRRQSSAVTTTTTTTASSTSTMVTRSAAVRNPFESVLAGQTDSQVLSACNTPAATMSTRRTTRSSTASGGQLLPPPSALPDSSKILKKARKETNNGDQNNAIVTSPLPVTSSLCTIAEHDEHDLDQHHVYPHEEQTLHRMSAELMMDDYEDWLTMAADPLLQTLDNAPSAMATGNSESTLVAGQANRKSGVSCTTTRRKSMAKVAALLDNLTQDVGKEYDFAAKFKQESVMTHPAKGKTIAYQNNENRINARPELKSTLVLEDI